MNIPGEQTRSLQARIVSGSLVLLSGSGLTTVINLAYNLLIARSLGPNGYGQATAVYTLLTLLSAITLAYQLIAAKLSAQNEEHSQAGAAAVQTSAWVCGLSAGVALLLFSGRITAFLQLSSPLLIMLLAAGAAFYIPLGARRGLVQGRQQGSQGLGKLARNLVLEGVMRLGGSILAIYLGWGVPGVVLANTVALILAYFTLITPRSPAATQRRPFAFVHREVAYAVVFFAGQMLINNCDIVLVKHFFPAALAGLYAVLAMVGRVLFALSQAVVNSMIPVVAGSRAEERNTLQLISTALLLVFALGSFVSLGLYFTPASLWTHLFGAGFALTNGASLPTLLALYAVTTVIYSLSAVLITYEMSYKIADNSWVQLLFAGFIIAGICLFHGSLEQVILVQLQLVLALLVVVLFRFLRGMAQESAGKGPSAHPPLPMMRQISEDEAIAAFLQSDFAKPGYARYHSELHALVYKPDLTSALDCARRRALLFTQHQALWNELPADTQWYELSLAPEDLARVRVFPRAHWIRLARGNFSLLSVVSRIEQRLHRNGNPFVRKLASIRKQLQAAPRRHAVLLIGRDETSPLVVLDGNHRLVSAVLDKRIDGLRFLCGLSPRMQTCCWYRTDLVSLARYAHHLLRDLTTRPGEELRRLGEQSREPSPLLGSTFETAQRTFDYSPLEKSL